MTSNPEELLDKTFHSLTTSMLREVKKINSGVNYQTAVFLQAMGESSILELLHIFHFLFLLLQQEAVTLVPLLQPSYLIHSTVLLFTNTVYNIYYIICRNLGGGSTQTFLGACNATYCVACA